MTPAEFAARAIGVPWVKWRSDWAAMDCFGCVVLYHREVHGIDLGAVPQTDIAAGFARATGWLELPGPEAGATCWMAWRNGAPTHCGIMLDARTVLHAEGNEHQPGSVRISRINAVRRVYGSLTFYRYSPC